MSNYYADIKLIGNILSSNSGTLFWEAGKVGLKDLKGNIIVPAEYDQIEKCRRYLYILKDNYLTLYCPGSIRSWNIKNDKSGYMYAEEGQLGWKDSDANILIPARYDEISRWGDDVFEVLSDGQWHYINCQLEEILTDFTPFDDDSEEEPPFDLYHPNNKVLTVREYVGREVKGDPNVVNINGAWVRISRKIGREISEMLVNMEDEYPMQDDDLRLFNNSFSYEYSVYLMHSNAENGVCDCMRQAYKMHAFEDSWYYLIKVWKAPKEKPLAKELRAIRYYTDNKERIGHLKFALGHDNSLDPGETMMLMVTHYNERCFPPKIEYDWTNFLCEQSLENIKAYLPELRSKVEETYLSKYIDEVWWDMLHDRINDISYSANRTWAETEKVLDYFKKYDTEYLYGVYWTVKHLMNCDTSKEDPYFYMNKLKWLLNYGAYVNTYIEGETGLDLLNKSPRVFLNNHPVDEITISECKKFMIQNGALTIKELKEREALNDDYSIELQRMRQ